MSLWAPSSVRVSLALLYLWRSNFIAVAVPTVAEIDERIILSKALVLEVDIVSGLAYFMDSPK